MSWWWSQPGNNNGSATLYPPANDPFVITVGATDDKATLDKADDVVASFSAYGFDDLGRSKPDLVAPGKNIIAYLPDVNSLTISQDASCKPGWRLLLPYVGHLDVCPDG